MSTPTLARDPVRPKQASAPADRHPLRIMAILATLMAFGSISTDLYLPAMPAMARDLGADTGAMEFTISGYLIGFSLGQLLWGAVSDRVGRRLPVAIGIILFVIGSAGCALSGSAAEVIGWRIVQAVGACAGVVLSRAMVRDLFSRDRAAQMLSTLIVIMAIAPLAGPLLGGQVLRFASWHWIFWLLVGIGGVTLAALFTVPETLAPEQRDPDAVRHALSRYGELLADRRILAYAGIGGFFYAGAFAYIAGSPFAYISYYHVPASAYGLLFGAAILGIMAMNMLNTRLVARFGSDHLLRAGAMMAAVTGLLAALAGWTGWGGLVGLLVPLLAFSALNGLIVANSLAGALAAWPDRAGAASALVGAIQYGSGILGSALVGLVADGTPWPLGLVIGLAGIGSLACTRLLPRG
ncbi:multidrug effflux MFS transporter [Sphingobium yanoikuyae]|uniref:multidrug effflux MFS transporter n=1 Tax=Sphingobium yanoikuyae TaxID=13690 RepID=UPI0028AB4D7F|nr:multidrug effflux MFS transporter [Sphingobium yanoikuyae]